MNRSDAVAIVLLGAMVSAACATPGPVNPTRLEGDWTPAPSAVDDDQTVGPDASPAPSGGDPGASWRSAVVEQAVRQLGRTRIRGDRSDCAGFVRSVFRAAGLSLVASSSALTSASQGLAQTVQGRLHQRPLPGDLAFFHDTYDRNHDGALGDAFSHVAIVESADRLGRVSLIHFGGHGVKRLLLDLSHPSVHRDISGVLNDYLRVRRADDAPGTRYLAGELLAGFGTPRPEAATIPAVSARAAPSAARRHASRMP